jgi:LPS-assembly lipoprotein
MKSNRLLCLLVLPFLVYGCGFHLQSKPEFPLEMQQVKLEVQGPYTQFARRLETHLEQNGVNVVTTRPEAAILEVPVNAARKEIQSIGDDARVREFLLRHSVQFRLVSSDGTELIPMQIIEQTRVYSFNEQDILSAEREDEFLRKDLADSLARMVVRRLGTFGK